MASIPANASGHERLTISRGSEFYTFVDDAACRVKFEFWRGRVFLHLFAKDAPLVVARRAHALRPAAAALLRTLGYTRVEVYFRERDRLQRFCRALGFVTTRQRYGWVFMEANNA